LRASSSRQDSGVWVADLAGRLGAGFLSFGVVWITGSGFWVDSGLAGKLGARFWRQMQVDGCLQNPAAQSAFRERILLRPLTRGQVLQRGYCPVARGIKLNRVEHSWQLNSNVAPRRGAFPSERWLWGTSFRIAGSEFWFWVWVHAGHSWISSMSSNAQEVQVRCWRQKKRVVIL